MNNILRSVGLTLAISTIVSFALLIASISFWTSFIVATIAQFIIFFIVGSVLEFINEIKLKEINALRLAEYSKQSLEIECPCFKKYKQVIPISLSAPNSYKCDECSKTNNVYITAEAVHVTEPISLV